MKCKYKITGSTFTFFLLVLGLIICKSTVALELEQDGGYHLTIGLEEQVKDYIKQSRQTPEEYVNEVQGILDQFATLLWNSLNNNFYIKSIQILVPKDWIDYFDANVSSKASSSYLNSDIQVSNNTFSINNGIPYTENYHTCGKPGNRIHLPFNFFGETVYGPQWKALLNLWLRYRFGVWEEHGYPEHPITPYFYNVNDLKRTPWILTSCNNSQLAGTYEKLDDYEDEENEEETCKADGQNKMSPSCRFNASVNSNTHVTSSLMNFGWVDSINQVCNETTHDKFVPNRQNLYCSFKSIWEVIRSSEDWLKLNFTNQPPTSRPAIDFEIVYEHKFPLLYLLLDKGDPTIQPEDELYEIWLEELTDFIDQLPNELVMTLSSYPVTSIDQWVGIDTEIIKEIDWTLLDATNREDFISALTFSSIRNITDYDFRIAIVEAIEELKLRNHPAGSVLLILKSGTGLNWTRYAGIYEEDLVMDMKLYGITLCAIEISPDPTPYLDYLATQTDGAWTFLNPKYNGDKNEAEEIRNVTDFILYKVSTPSEGSGVEYDIIYREDLRNIPKNTSHILIPKRQNVETIFIRITAKSSNNIGYLRFQFPGDYPFTKRIEWNQQQPWEYEGNETTKITYSTNINLTLNPEDEYATVKYWELYIKINSTEGSAGLISVYGTRKKSNEPNNARKRRRRRVDSEIRNTNTSATLDANEYIWMNAEITTSVINQRDWTCSNAVPEGLGLGLGSGILWSDSVIEPLSIFVKLTSHNGQPFLYDAVLSTNLGSEVPYITNPTRRIYALLLNLNTGSFLDADLNDSGYGADLAESDGVYSAYIYPNEAGIFRIYASFIDRNSRSNASQIEVSTFPFGTLLDMRQSKNHMKINRNGIILSGPFSSVNDSPGLIHVKTQCVRNRYISRVLTLTAEESPFDTDMIKLSFNVPQLITTKDDSLPETNGSYNQDINFQDYYFGIVFHLTNISLENAGQTEILHSFVVKILPTGQTFNQLVNRSTATNSTIFGIQLLEIGQQNPTKSAISNLARIQSYRTGKDIEDSTDGSIPSLDAIMIIAIAGGSGFVILVLLVILCLLIRSNRQQRSQLRQLLSKKDIKEFHEGAPATLARKTVIKSTVPVVTAKKDELGMISISSASSTPAVDNEYLDTSELVQALPYDAKYEIPKSKLHIDRTELLGQGQFGQVFKGYLVGSSSGKVLVVAVKTMKPSTGTGTGGTNSAATATTTSANVLYFKTLLAEVKLMVYIGKNSHPNIISLVGACTKHIRKCEVFIATEYCSNGALLHYLHKMTATFKDLRRNSGTNGDNDNVNINNVEEEEYDDDGFLPISTDELTSNTIVPSIITTWHLIKWCREIASGMEYLGIKKIVHSDLAARNILLDSKLIAKISDFGLSKQLMQYSMYVTEEDEDGNDNEEEIDKNNGTKLLLPWKWMSPEVLSFMKFSIKSDVWSFGITMWEIFTLGQNPYPGIRWTLNFVNQLENGLRLLIPNYATKCLYKIMLDCWEYNSIDRPSFTNLKNRLDQVLIQIMGSGQDYLDFSIENYETNNLQTQVQVPQPLPSSIAGPAQVLGVNEEYTSV